MNTELKVVKSNLGLFIKFGNYYMTKLSDIRVNGVDVKPTHAKEWGFIEGETEVKNLEFFEQNEKINPRYELKNKDIASDTIPLTISQDDLERDYDGDWTGKFVGMGGLYSLVYDKVDPYWKEYAFEAQYDPEIEIKNLSKPVEMTVKAISQHYFSKQEYEKPLSEIVTYSGLVDFLVPEFLKHERPCSISSDQIYQIIRAYIKDNIDPANATITSDYDFCFTVKKRIKIKPYIHKWEEKQWNGKGYRKPRFRSREVSYKEMEIFEMTPASKKYGAYAVISGIDASNLQEMADRLKAYLDDLMEYINMPVQECPNCNGCGGFVVGSKPDIKAA